MRKETFHIGPISPKKGKCLSSMTVQGFNDAGPKRFLNNFFHYEPWSIVMIYWRARLWHSRKLQAEPSVPRRLQRHYRTAFKNRGLLPLILKSHQFRWMPPLLIILVQSVNPADHYIRAGATGNNDGSSWTNAWKSFSSVTWTRGDTYYGAFGIYMENVTIAKTENSALWIYLKKATIEAHGTDTGWNDSYAAGQVEIQGTFTVSNSYIEVDGVTGSDSSGHGIKIFFNECDTVFNGKSIMFLGTGKSNIHLHHLEIAGCGYGTYDATDGVYHLGPAINLQVSDSWIHNVSRNGVTIGGHQGTAFTDGNIGFLFENNRVEKTGGCTYPDWHGQGMQIGYSNMQYYMVIRNNKFVDMTGTGYIAFLGLSVNDHIRIYNNIFYATDRVTFNASPGVITFLSSANYVNDVLIYNNTFYNIDLKGVTNWCDSGTGNELKNNLFVNSRFTYGQIGFVSQYNDYYGNIGGGSVGVPTGEAGQQTETASPFVDSTNHDFHLVPTATGARNNGVNLSSVFATDRDGVARPQGSAWDIGAYEYVSSGMSEKALNRPYSALEVFPNPFNSVVTIRLLHGAGSADIEIYSIVGAKVAAFTNSHDDGIIWHADNHASGVYLMKVRMSGQILQKCIQLIR